MGLDQKGIIVDLIRYGMFVLVSKGKVQYGMIRYVMVWYGKLWYGKVCDGAVRYSIGIVWYGMVQYSICTVCHCGVDGIVAGRSWPWILD